MAQYSPLQLSFWYTAQTVTAANMNNLTQDMYAKFQALTQNVVGTNGCILNMQGMVPQIVAGSVTIPSGFFRFPDHIYAFMTYNPAIFGYAPSNTVSGISGNGFIVARYVISSTSPNQTNYTFPATYVFTASADPVTDCIIATVQAGNIIALGKFYINTPITANFNNVIQATGSTTNILPNNNFAMFSNAVFAAPATYVASLDANVFPIGWSCSIYDNPDYPVTISLIAASTTKNIVGLQLGGFYILETDGTGNADWFISYQQNSLNYFPHTNNYSHVIEATAPLTTIVNTDAFAVFTNFTLGTPVTYVLDLQAQEIAGQPFFNGWSCALLDNSTDQITISLVGFGGNTDTITGDQLDGYYLIQTDGANWFVSYEQNQSNYSPYVTHSQFEEVFSSGIAPNTRPIAEFNGSGIVTEDDFSSSLTARGHITFPDGTIIQWDRVSVPSSGSATFTDFDIPFPNNVFSLTVGSTVDMNTLIAFPDSLTQAALQQTSGGTALISYMAIGN